VYHQVGAELPVDSDDADAENQNDNGNTLLFVFERGYRYPIALYNFLNIVLPAIIMMILDL
jgi:hypothetical protein